MSDWSLRMIAAWLECFQEKSSWCRNEQVCQGRKSVKHFERSNGLDGYCHTALHKTIPLPLFYLQLAHCAIMLLLYFPGESLVLSTAVIIIVICLSSLLVFMNVCVYEDLHGKK